MPQNETFCRFQQNANTSSAPTKQYLLQHQEKHQIHGCKQDVMSVSNSGEQRRIPSVVIVDHPLHQASDRTKHHVKSNQNKSANDNQKFQDFSSLSVTQPRHHHDSVSRGKVSPGSGRLLPYVPKRYVIPRVAAAGDSSPSGNSSSSATTAKRVQMRGVSFEDEVIQESEDLGEETDINAPIQPVDSVLVESDEYINDESEGVDLNNQETDISGGDFGNVTSDGENLVGDFGNVTSDGENLLTDGEGTTVLPAILRDYMGPAPSSAADRLRRKRGDVLSPPAPPDDITKHLLEDLSMGPFNKEFDALTSTTLATTEMGTGLVACSTEEGVSVAGVDLLSNNNQEHTSNYDVLQMPSMFGRTNQLLPYHATNGDRLITSDISTTLDTYGTYQRGPSSNKRLKNGYRKSSHFIRGGSVSSYHNKHTYQPSSGSTGKMGKSTSNQYDGGQSFFDDDFLTETEKERLSYLRTLETDIKHTGSNNGYSTFNRRTSDSLLDTLYHHSNIFESHQHSSASQFVLDEDEVVGLDVVAAGNSAAAIGQSSSSGEGIMPSAVVGQLTSMENSSAEYQDEAHKMQHMILNSSNTHNLELSNNSYSGHENKPSSSPIIGTTNNYPTVSCKLATES